MAEKIVQRRQAAPQGANVTTNAREAVEREAGNLAELIATTVTSWTARVDALKRLCNGYEPQVLQDADRVVTELQRAVRGDTAGTADECHTCQTTAERVQQFTPAIRAPMLRKLREVSDHLDMHCDSFGQLSALFHTMKADSADHERLGALGNYTAENYAGIMLACKLQLDEFIAENNAEAEA